MFLDMAEGGGWTPATVSWSLYRSRFGEHIPMIRRENVGGFVARRPVWLVRPLGLKAVQKQAELMELETISFYEAAAKRTSDAGIRQLLGDLIEEERHHAHQGGTHQRHAALNEEVNPRRKNAFFLLQIVQPGLAGLMDGSVSTLAPLFAAAFATHQSMATFQVGLAASVGAGISMGFAEALSDDGSLTGRGHPWARGLVCGAMTALGGLGHTLRAPHPKYPHRHMGRRRRRPHRAWNHLLGPPPFHGHPPHLRHPPDRIRRRISLRRRRPHRQLINRFNIGRWKLDVQSSNMLIPVY